ncbi:MAG: murein biosynthesis integral membrane protein MurJ [Aquificaceae bacterium]|nr:murein biosynthesis integral membrane protein MurJ [Aquificaceae bacterium]MDW8032229.1 murein biosynthesis integral membrane protein MurJ [Aquificaceae bacterium]MDW8293877.1 murein biosynthesis integral membrane protein MurJ [Aquificaceae bacterium]
MNLIKHSLSFSIATLLSRVLGYVRDALIAYHFGVSPVTDAFFVAFRLPNTFRRLFGEGGFNAAFVPIFAKRLKEGTEKPFLNSVFSYYTLFNLLVTLLGVLTAEWVVRLIAPGITGKGYYELAVFMARFLFSYLFFVGLSALFMAVLNTRGVFFVPAFAQGVFNLSMSLAIALFAQKLGYMALVLGVVFGGLFQLLFHLPWVLSRGLLPELTLSKDRDLSLLLRRLFPAVLGFGVAQLSFFIDTFLASFLALGAISYLYYANRIFQLPLGALSVGIANSLLSVLSGGSDPRGNITLAFRFITLLALPATGGLVVLSFQIVDLLYGRGRFSQEDVNIAGKVLAVYSLGLVFFSLQKVLASVFFAKGDTRTPVLSSLFAVLSEGLLAFLFAFLLKLGVVGLALGTSSSSLTGFLFLLYFWRERNIDLPLYAYSLLKGAAGTALMCLFLIFTRPKSYELLYAIPFAVLLYWFFLLLVREPLAYLPLSLFKSLVKKLINSGSSP